MWFQQEENTRFRPEIFLGLVTKTLGCSWKKPKKILGFSKPENFPALKQTKPGMLCNGIGALPHLQMGVAIIVFVEDFH